MRRPVAAQVLEVNRITHTSATGLINRVAGFIRPPVDSKSLTTVFQHLGHEWQIVQRGFLVERRKYVVRAANLNIISRQQRALETIFFQLCHGMSLNSYGGRVV